MSSVARESLKIVTARYCRGSREFQGSTRITWSMCIASSLKILISWPSKKGELEVGFGFVVGVINASWNLVIKYGWMKSRKTFLWEGNCDRQWVECMTISTVTSSVLVHILDCFCDCNKNDAIAWSLKILTSWLNKKEEFEVDLSLLSEWNL